MKRLLFFILIKLLFATPINSEQAVEMAKNVIYERGGIDRSQLIIDEIIDIGSEMTYLYVINFQEQGFAIISADDRVLPILGYGFEGTIDTENLPDQLINIFQSWQNGIRNVINNNIISTSEIDLEWQKYRSIDLEYNPTRDEVQPLITAQWNQAGAWNNMCPGNALVGCVAVSMAQVMYYWQYPTAGQGYNSYYEPDYGDIAVDFSFSSYNYENMQDNNATSDSQLLLYNAGVSVNMDYGNNASGAYVVYGSNSALNALTEHFQYSEEIDAVYRSSYSDNQWDQLLKNELDEERPIIFRAYDDNSGAGHAWNIDGYQGENHFHCNWGWGGSSNGYYYLNNLNAGGYNFIIDQAAIINIFPVASGCTDINALNYDSSAQIENGSCFWELSPPEDIILLNQGNTISAMIGYDVLFYPEIISDDGLGNLIFLIKLINPEEEVAGFQFGLNSNSIGLDQYEINNIYGGIAEDNNFTVQELNGIILGFSFTGDIIPIGEHDLFYISALYDPNNISNNSVEITTLNSTDIVFSNYIGNNLNSLFIPANFKFSTGYSELNLDPLCGDGICNQEEVNNCFSDCNNIVADIQYAVTQNDIFIESVPTINNYLIENLDYDTEYCYEFQSFYNNQYSNSSNSVCINTSLPPQIELNILDLAFNLEVNEVALDTILITNSGESSLDFDITYDSNIQFSSQFIGEYYSSTGTGGSPAFGELILTREDDVIDFNWGGGSPDALIPNDDFQIRWTGNIFTEISGEYNFRSYTDDGLRLYIDNILVIDHWFSQGSTSRYGDIFLETGYHELVMEYYEDGGGAVAGLYWTAPGSLESLVYPAENGWLTLNQYQGMIFPGQSEEIIISVQSNNIDIGFYNTILNIHNNDPNSFNIDIPISLSVGLPDCFGTIGGVAYIDDCGICSAGETGSLPNIDMDCFGICFGSAINDINGNCCEVGYVDECNECNGQNECFGCMDESANNYNENMTIDDGSCQYIGDINNDGLINISDIVLIVNIILDSQYNELGDLNNDGSLNIVDIILLVQIILNV